MAEDHELSGLHARTSANEASIASLSSQVSGLTDKVDTGFASLSGSLKSLNDQYERSNQIHWPPLAIAVTLILGSVGFAGALIAMQLSSLKEYSDLSDSKFSQTLDERKFWTVREIDRLVETLSAHKEGGHPHSVIDSLEHTRDEADKMSERIKYIEQTRAKDTDLRALFEAMQ